MKVLLTRRVPGEAEDMLRAADGVDLRVHEEPAALSPIRLREMAAGCAGVLTQLSDRIDADFFDAAGKQLKVVSNYAVGFNNIDVDEATRRGVAVCNTPGVLTEATADIAWALLMAVSRRVIEGDRLMRTGSWDGWKPDELLGTELVGKTIAIVGAGRIGAAVARRATAWRMKIIYVARQRHELFERDFHAPKVELDEALAMADFVSLHVPLTEATRHLLNRQRLGRMKPTAYLINTARGPVMDEAALVEALRAGRLAGAGLDVYEDEPAMHPGLAELPNVVVLPHLGSATRETRAAMGRLAAENLLAVLAGERPLAIVNPQALEN